MENENDIELSLGLSFGSSSGKAKAVETPLDPKAGVATDDQSGCISASDAPFKHFSGSNNEKHEVSGPSSVLQESFWTDLKRAPSQGLDAPLIDTHSYQGPRSESSANKRKSTYEEKWKKKKHETEAEAKHPAKNSIVHVTIDDGSSAENEGVAESEAEGPTSRHSFHEGRQHDADGYNFSRKVEIHEIEIDIGDTQKHKNGGSELRGTSKSLNLPTARKTPPYSLSATAPSHEAISLKKQEPSSSSEYPAFQAVSANLQRFFGHPAVLLPTLEKFSAFSSPADCRLEGNKHLIVEEGGSSLSRKQEESNRFIATSAPKDYSEQPSIDGFLNEGFPIRPGIAANINFGGNGTSPDLPWVSTTGTGPHGRTISGVTYKYAKNHVKIVCACHGLHLSPEEFVQHATIEFTSSENVPIVALNPDNSAASAMS